MHFNDNGTGKWPSRRPYVQKISNGILVLINGKGQKIMFPVQLGFVGNIMCNDPFFAEFPIIPSRQSQN